MGPSKSNLLYLNEQLQDQTFETAIMADVEERSASIDETPLSPRDPKRRDSLEKHLQHRPDPKELKERHILLDSNAAPSVFQVS